MVGLEGVEPPTNGLGNRCSILLSYRPTMWDELAETSEVAAWLGATSVLGMLIGQCHASKLFDCRWPSIGVLAADLRGILLACNRENVGIMEHPRQ